MTALEWETTDDAAFLFNEVLLRAPQAKYSRLTKVLFGITPYNGDIRRFVIEQPARQSGECAVTVEFFDDGDDYYFDLFDAGFVADAIRDVYAPPYPYTLRSRNGREAAKVIQSRATMFGCCDRHADYLACDCLGLSGMFVPEQFPKRSTELAESIYQEVSKQTDPRLPADALMVLSDSLEEFGLPTEYMCWVCRGKGNDPIVPVTPGQFITEVACDNCNGEGHLTHPILAHLRNGKTHFDGCWALQLLRNLENDNG